MTIKQQVETIFNHPFFRYAMEKFNCGDDSELKHLFFEVQFHAYQKSILNAARAYGQARWLDTCEILEEVRNTAPPENLDMRLRIPDKREYPPKPVPKKAKVRHVITNQLSLFLQITYLNGKETSNTNQENLPQARLHRQAVS